MFFLYKIKNIQQLFVGVLILSIMIVNQSKSQAFLFDEFKENNRSWVLITDQVMGGLSFGSYSFGKENNDFYMRMEGNVTTENNGGFIQVRREIDNTSPLIKEGITFEARGNNNDYFIHIRTKYTLLPWQYYQAKFTVKRDWGKVRVDLKDFNKSGLILPNLIKPSTIKSLAIVAYGKKYKARVDVKKISFY